MAEDQGQRQRKRLIKPIEFAHEVGVSHVAISRLKKTRLADAFEGKYINANHPAAVAYANETNKKRKGGASTPVPAKYRGKNPQTSASTAPSTATRRTCS